MIAQETEDPFEKARQLRAAGVPLPEIEAYLQQKTGGGGITPGHSKFTPAQLVGRANRTVAQSEDELEAAGGHDPTTHKIMGTAASLARDVPGAEAVQAFTSSRVNRVPYTEALRDIREVESDAGAAGTVARIVGGASSAAALPGSAVQQGAGYGYLHGLLGADPVSAEDRQMNAALGGTVGALTAGIAPKIPGLVSGAARWAGSNIAATADAALLPFSHGARVRMVGRVAGLLRDATKAGTKAGGAATDNVAAPMVEGYQPIGEMIERARTTVLPFRGPSSDGPLGIKEAAGSRLAALLQKNLDEGMDAAESVKGYPIRNDPPSNPDLMRRIQEALMRAKAERAAGGAVTAARATPRGGITTPPRTVADVLRGGQ